MEEAPVMYPIQIQLTPNPEAGLTRVEANIRLAVAYDVPDDDADWARLPELLTASARKGLVQALAELNIDVTAVIIAAAKENP